VPSYDWVLPRDGAIGGTIRLDGSGIAASEEFVTVRFVAAEEPAWPGSSARPERERVRIGEDNLAFFEAHNPTDRPVAGQATFNVVPYALEATSPRCSASASRSRSCSPARLSRCR
jgi:cytochrome c oxidase assembly protein subunit 11